MTTQLVHHQRQEGESCGKDEDWINAKLLVQVPEPRRRQMLEATTHGRDKSWDSRLVKGRRNLEV